MPLQKQEIRVPFGGGVDTKTDEKQVVPGKLLTLKNGQFQNLRQITKREAFETPFSDQTVGWDAHNRDTIEEGACIYGRDKELLIVGRQTNQASGDTSHEDGWYMYTHDSDNDEWKNIGTRQPLRLGVEAIAEPTAQWVVPDVAMLESATGPTVAPVVNERWICYGWLELVDPADATDNRNARVTIKDLQNDATLIDKWSSDVTLSAVDVQGVHVTGIDGTPADFYVWLAVPSTNDIYMSTASIVTLSTIGNPVVKITDLNAAATPLWDTCTTYLQGSGTCSVVAYQDDSVPPDIYVRWFDETGTEVDQAFINDDPKGAITVFSALDDRTGDTKVVVVWQSASDNKIYGQTYSSDGTAYAGPYLIVNVDYGDRIRNITGCNDTASDFYVALSSFYRIFYEVANDATNTAPCWCDVRSAAVEYDGTNAQAPVNVSNVALASKAFEYESKARVWMVHDSFGLIDAIPDPDVYNWEIQNTYFLESLQGDYPPDSALEFRTDARCLGGRAHGQSFAPALSAVVNPSAGQYLFAGLRKDVLIVPDHGTSLDSVVGITTDFTETALPSTQMGPCLQTGGGYVGCADGRHQESDFHLYPESLVAVVTATGGNPVTWQYTVVYEWTDREGQIHRSAPAIPIEVTATDTDPIAITVNCLTLGDPGRLSDVRCVLYRTEDAGTVFYRLPTPTHQLNNPLVSRITLLDSPGPAAAAADTTIVDYETLYTTGDVLANHCPPATSIMNEYQDRVILVPDEDRTAHWFSKLKRHSQGLSFTELFNKRITDGGDTTAMIAMDTRQVVFKESQVRAFSGDGPNDLGVGGFTEDHLITADVGCSDRASVVWTDKGVMFKSLKGIYLLGRNLQVQYIGGPVEEYNQYRVINATLVETKNQVRFLLENYSMLVYDYLVDQWSVFEAPQGAQFTAWDCVDSAMWQNQYVMVKDDGTVYLETAAFQDGTTDYIPMDFTTAWIKLNGLQGYQRVWWISLLGEVFDNCTINYEICYDYVDTNPQTGSIVVDAAFQADPPAQFRIKPRMGNGKCQAFRVRVYDATAAGATNYKGFAISDIMIQIGKKSGVMRQGVVKSR